MYIRLLQRSSLLVTKAWTRVSKNEGGNLSLINRSLLRWKNDACTTLLIYGSMEKLEDITILHPDWLSYQPVVLKDSQELVEMGRKTALSWFNLRWFKFIHFTMSWNSTETSSLALSSSPVILVLNGNQKWLSSGCVPRYVVSSVVNLYVIVTPILVRLCREPCVFESPCLTLSQPWTICRLCMTTLSLHV